MVWVSDNHHLDISGNPHSNAHKYVSEFVWLWTFFCVSVHMLMNSFAISRKQRILQLSSRIVAWHKAILSSSLF